jgi:hypothetical protein
VVGVVNAPTTLDTVSFRTLASIIDSKVYRHDTKSLIDHSTSGNVLQIDETGLDADAQLIVIVTGA